MIALGLARGRGSRRTRGEPGGAPRGGDRARGPRRQPRGGSRGRRLPHLGHRIARVADRAPAVPDRARPRSDRRDRGRTGRAPGRDPARRRRLHDRAGRAARRRPRVGLPRPLRRGTRRPAARAVPHSRAPLLAGVRERLPPWRARSHPLRIRPDRDRLGTRRRRRCLRRRAHPYATPRFGSSPWPSLRKEPTSRDRRPLQPPLRSREAPQRRAHRRPRPRAGPRDAQGRRASRTTTSRSRSSASRRRGSRPCPAT